MGLFGSRNEIHVTSVAYNMAGDEVNRPNYLRSLVSRNILSGTSDTIAETIQNGYQNGPSNKFRSFFNWANNHYDYIGLPEGKLNALMSISGNIVSPYIPKGPDETAWVQQAHIGDADYGMWIEQWFLQNAPELADTAWSASINENTNQITINFEDNTSTSFYPNGFDKEAKYVFAYYILTGGEVGGAIQTGSVVSLGSDPLPDVSNWVFVNEFYTPQQTNLETRTTVLMTYSDGRPNEDSTDSVFVLTNHNIVSKHYTRILYQGYVDPSTGETISAVREYQYQGNRKVVENILVSLNEVTEEIEPGVFRTTTTKVTQDILVDDNEYRIDTQDVTINSWSRLKLHIYKMGSGIADLDNKLTQIEDYGRFFPMIPVRIDNEFLSNSFEPTAYDLAKRAYKKVTDGNLDALIEEIADNEHIEEIDYAYIVFGVSLNVIDNSAKLYMYNFFKNLMQNQIGGPNLYNDFINQETNYTQAFNAWQQWRHAQENFIPPLYGTPAPTIPDRISMAINELSLKNNGQFKTDYDVRILWTYIKEGSGIGLGRPSAKKGDLWFTYEGEDQLFPNVHEQHFLNNNPSNTGNINFTGNVIEKVRLWFQKENNSYEYLDIVGLRHLNYIYEGKYVEISAKEALEDEDESGFIIPLHNGTFRQTNVVNRSQMITASCFIVFNCYVVRRRRWYERGIFRIILSIIVAVISVLFTGGVGLGLLGSHFAVGSFLGLSGMSAAIAGAVANAVAAIVLSSVIESVAVKLFGPKWAGLFSALFSFFAFSSIMNFHNTGSFAINWGTMLRADNLLKLTDALGNGYASAIGHNINVMREEHEEFMRDNARESRRILEAYYRDFGFGGGEVDPMLMVNNNSSDGRINENHDTFLARTLMTGTDIAEMSKELLNNFAELSLILPDAFSR